jgi:hypothetical protein
MNFFKSMFALPMITLATSGSLMGCFPEDDEDSDDASEVTSENASEIRNGILWENAPGIAYFQYSDALQSSSCTAVALTNDVFVTAAHCVNHDADGSEVSKDVVELADHANTQKGIANIVRYPTGYDVALLFLISPWQIGDSTTGFVRPISHQPTTEIVNQFVYCAGNGPTTPNGADVGPSRVFYSRISSGAGAWNRVENDPFGRQALKGDSGGGCFDLAGNLIGIMSYADDATNPTYITNVSAELILPFAVASVPGIAF